MDRPAILAQQLEKTYNIPKKLTGKMARLRQLVSREVHSIRAVDNVSFSVQEGEFVGYIGPNGAGKSTTVKMLAGILHPTSGKLLVNGLCPANQRQQLAWHIGVVFGQRTQLWWDLPTRDSFELLAAMYEVSRQQYSAWLERFEQMLGLHEFLDVPVRRLSLGQRMRADLAAALLHRPALLLLDEPTIGLDVIAKNRIREFLRYVNAEERVTIVLTSHDLRDIEQLCKRVMVIDHGNLVFDGSMSRLRQQAALPTTLKVRYLSMPEHLYPGTHMGCGTSAQGILRVLSIEPESTSVSVQFDRNQVSAAEALARMHMFGEIVDISMEEPLIEQVIRRLLEPEGKAGLLG